MHIYRCGTWQNISKSGMQARKNINAQDLLRAVCVCVWVVERKGVERFARAMEVHMCVIECAYVYIYAIY